MTAISHFFATETPLLRQESPATEFALIHLANPKRRSLIRTIGYEGATAQLLRQEYGPSWGAIQADLRLLVQQGYIVSSGQGQREHFSLDLSAFPHDLLQGVLAPVAGQRFALAA